MAGNRSVVNPLAALKSVSDYRLGKDDAGETIVFGTTETGEYRAAATVAKGDIVALLAPPDAVTPASVTPKVTARLFASVIGVVEKGGVAGSMVTVAERGPTFVNVGAGTPAANNTATIQGNSTQAGVSAAEADATTVVGSILGVFLGAKDGSNLAPVFVNIR